MILVKIYLISATGGITHYSNLMRLSGAACHCAFHGLLGLGYCAV
jgi:hypothetical protein